MVKRLSDNIASYLSYELHCDHDKREVLSYGLQIVLGGFLKVSTLLVLSLILGIFSYTMIGMFSFSAFRTIIGGAHKDTYGKCFITSIVLLLVIGTMGKLFGSLMTNHMWLSFITFAYAMVVILIWVPAGTEKKEIKNRKLRIKMKIKAGILLTLWLILVLLSPIYNYHQYMFSSILGVFSTFFFVTPPAYKLMKIKFKLKGVI